MKLGSTRARLLPLALLTATTLGGCATSHLGAPAKPTVQLSRDCEDLARSPAMPGVKAGEHAKVSLAKTRVVLAGAIDSLDDTRECQERQRERLASGGP